MTGEDDLNTYSVDERRELTERLQVITEALHAGGRKDRPLDLRLLQDLHFQLFEGVRSHAGKHRRTGQGSERVVFGPHRSTHSRDVERELSGVFRELERRERALADECDEGVVLEGTRLAVWVHAAVVRIHPFEDGNGRVSRLCATHILVRHGLRPVAIEAVKQEYTEALNHYFVTSDLDPLVDLYLRLSPVGR